MIGSISTCTLRTEDLLKAFADTLEELVRDKPLREREDDERLIYEARSIPPTSILGADILEDLADTLNAYAPEGTYFGTHPDDGADFGFWPIETEDS